jgi:geranylgeranyl diphosphate synthase type I
VSESIRSSCSSEKSCTSSTAWTVFGPARALLAGDGMLAVAYQLLDSAAAQGLLARAVDRLVSGQADDLEFEGRTDVTYSDYLAMSMGKTGALLGAAACLGAALGPATLEQLAALTEYGEQVGLAFQLVDDLLGIWGDPAVTGKPVLSDVRSRKKSAPIVLAAAESAQVRAYLEGADAEPAAIAEAIEATGARERVRAEVAVHVERAGRALAGATLEPAAVAELLRTAAYVTGRDR